MIAGEQHERAQKVEVEFFLLLHIGLAATLVYSRKDAYFVTKYSHISDGVSDKSHDPIPNRVICT